MVLLFADSFDLYDADTDIVTRGWASNTQQTAFFTSGGVWNGGYLETWGDIGAQSTAENSAQVYLPSVHVGYLFCGFWFMKDGTGSTTVQFLDWMDPQNSTQLSLGWDKGTLAAWRGNRSTRLGIARQGLPEQVWIWMETKIKIDDSTGFVEVRANGQVLLSLSNIDTKQTAMGGCAAVRLYNTSNGPPPTSRWDDIIIWNDVAGDRFNDWIGEQRIVTLRPTADDTANWTRSSGSTNSSLVNESYHDADTSYVESNTLNQKDFYVMGDLPANFSLIKGMQTVHTAKKTNAGTRMVKHRIKGTAEAASADIPLDSAYVDTRALFSDDPDNSGQPLTSTVVNNLKFGMEVTG